MTCMLVKPPLNFAHQTVDVLRLRLLRKEQSHAPQKLVLLHYRARQYG